MITRRPVSISASSRPQANRSLPAVLVPVSMYSGAMYMDVPTSAMSGAVSLLMRKAMPKSITRGKSSASTMMLAGFRSRCTTPCSCAWSTASRMRVIIDTARAGGIAPFFFRKPASVSPSTNSNTR